MARLCTVCRDPRLSEIDAALVAGEPLRNVSLRFAIGLTSVYRHKRDHLPVALTQAAEASHTNHADDLLGQVRALVVRALAILDRAERDGRDGVALGAIRELRSTLELQARMLAVAQQREEPMMRGERADEIRERVFARIEALAERRVRMLVAAGESVRPANGHER